MNSFISFAQPLKQILSEIVSHPVLHSKWLNTLSYLENCGARKIAYCEHPRKVKEEMLKHAAEEFRHAHYLKRQIEKISSVPLIDYAPSLMLGKTTSLHYLAALDLKTSQYLAKTVGLPKSLIKEACYLLVTYAIELRASELYPIYEEILRQNNSKVFVRSILLEEEEHLSDMQKELEQFPRGMQHVEHICDIESTLCEKWLRAIKQELYEESQG